MRDNFTQILLHPLKTSYKIVYYIELQKKDTNASDR